MVRCAEIVISREILSYKCSRIIICRRQTGEEVPRLAGRPGGLPRSGLAGGDWRIGPWAKIGPSRRTSVEKAAIAIILN